jgi:hypothetical protein
MIKQLSFYKPNSKNTGVAVSVNAGAKDGGLYISFIRQFSWNPEKKTGSFKENKDVASAKKNIKFNQFEAGGIIRAIETKDKWSAFHKFGADSGVSIYFSPYEREEVLVGFGLKILDSRDKDNPFSVGFTLDEVICLREYLKEYIRNGFYEEAPVDTAETAESE